MLQLRLNPSKYTEGFAVARLESRYQHIPKKESQQETMDFKPRKNKMHAQRAAVSGPETRNA